MNAKEYLQQALLLDKQIQTDCLEIERLRALSESIPSTLMTGDRVQSSGHSDRIADTVARIIDLENVYFDEINRLVSLKAEIYKQICNLEDEKLKMILQRRYVSFQIWDDIAVEMSCEVRWIYELHKKALNEFSKIFEVQANTTL